MHSGVTVSAFLIVFSVTFIAGVMACFLFQIPKELIYLSTRGSGLRFQHNSLHHIHISWSRLLFCD
jgi:hypothetical protein